MKHRGPDWTGVRMHESPMPINDGTVHIASGHQRLSILDLDKRSNQPFCREKQSLIYNGEIYNFRELRASIDDGSHPFDTSGDTEVLFRGLSRFGLDFIRQANGMWAFTFLDENKKIILASRDRYGKKPIFYYQDSGCVIFSSTIQAIREYLGISFKLRDDQVDAYLAHGMMFPSPDERTHVENIHQIPAGGSLEFDLETWKIRLLPYFDVRQQFFSEPPAKDALPELILDAVKARLVSDRKVGLLLSGGIDSTLVLSAIHTLGLLDQVHCFIGETGRSEDAEFAKQCITQLGVEATIVNLDYGSDTFSRVLKMCRHQEKAFPFLGSAMGMSEMYERIAEYDVRVVLDGTGGDEVFGGYWDRYFPSAIREAFRHRDWPWLRDAWNHAPNGRDLMCKTAKDTLLHQFMPGMVSKRYSRAARALGMNHRRPKSMDPLATPPPSFVEAMARDISPGGRLGEWIWHNDRNAMMSGIENRSPILDYRLIPYMHTGYAEKFHKDWNKYELRKVFDALTPLPTQWRKQKQGFRWNGKAFLKENTNAILELIESSTSLSNRYPIRRFIDEVSRNPCFVTDKITSRLLCIAALEAEIGLS